jgi:hypothetical protein
MIMAQASSGWRPMPREEEYGVLMPPEPAAVHDK